MLRERETAVANVASVFRIAERSIEQAAIAGARCIATMMEERANANLPVETGADQLKLIAEGVRSAVEAHVAFVTAHRGLRQIPEQIGVRRGAETGYGTGDCPPNEHFTSATAPLRVVG